MGSVTLQIAGRAYSVACRDGEEDHLRQLASRVDAKAAQARASVGSVNEVRQLLFAALLLADEVDSGASLAAHAPGGATALDALAARVEAIADALERAASAS